MKKEAELHAEEDKKKREQVEIKNQAEAAVFQAEKLIKDAGDKVKPEDKKELEEKVEALKKVKDSDNFDEIKKKMEELSAVAQKIGAAMYQAASADASASQAGQADGGEPRKDQGPIEGEFTEKK